MRLFSLFSPSPGQQYPESESRRHQAPPRLRSRLRNQVSSARSARKTSSRTGGAVRSRRSRARRRSHAPFRHSPAPRSRRFPPHQPRKAPNHAQRRGRDRQTGAQRVSLLRQAHSRGSTSPTVAAEPDLPLNAWNSGASHARQAHEGHFGGTGPAARPAVHVRV